MEEQERMDTVRWIDRNGKEHMRRTKNEILFSAWVCNLVIQLLTGSVRKIRIEH